MEISEFFRFFRKLISELRKLLAAMWKYVKKISVENKPSTKDCLPQENGLFQPYTLYVYACTCNCMSIVIVLYVFTIMNYCTYNIIYTCAII